MANELRYIGLETQTGLTVTAEIYGEDGVQVGGAIAATEVGATSIYTADMPSVAAATYAIRFFSSGAVIGSGAIEWNGAEEVTARDLEADIATVDTVVDAILVDTDDLQTNQGNFATATGFATPADITSAVAPLATQASVDTIDGIVDDILVDTNELQTNQGNFATATGFATPSDVTTAVAPLATQASVDIIDGIVDAILVDTNELQTNQGNFATATGFATPADVAAVGVDTDQILLDIAALSIPTAAQIYAEFTTGSNEDVFKADLTGIALSSEVAAVGADTDQILLDLAALSIPTPAQIYAEFISGTNEDAFKADVSGLATSAEISALNNITAADVYAEFTAGTNEDAFKADLTGIALSSEVAAVNADTDQILLDIAAISIPTVGAIADAVWDEPASDHTTAGSTGEVLQNGTVDLQPVLNAIAALNDPTAAEIYTFFTTGSNEDAFKADVSNLATAAALAVVDANVDQVLLDVAALPAAPSASDIYTFFTSGNNEDAFKADVSGLTVDLQPVLDAISTQTTTLTGRFDTVDTSLTAVNNDTDQIIVDIAALDTVVNAGFSTTGAAFVALDAVVDAGFAATQASFVALDAVVDAGFATGATSADVAAVPAAVWQSLTSVNYGAGSFGEYIKFNLDVPISSSSALVRTVDSIEISFNTPSIEVEIDTSGFAVS